MPQIFPYAHFGKNNVENKWSLVDITVDITTIVLTVKQRFLGTKKSSY